MDLVLLGAGFATRLEPLTLDQPKHLLPTRHGVFADKLMDQLKKVESHFNQKIIITNNRYFDKFEKYANDLNQGYHVFKDGVNNKQEKIGAIGDLFSAIQQAQLDGDLLILAMDYILEQFDFEDFIKFIKDKKTSVTVSRIESDTNELKSNSCLLVDKTGKLTRFQEKPTNPFSNLCGVPIYFVKKEDVALIKDLPKELWDNCGQIIKAILEKSEIYAYRYDGSYLHMTTIDDYNAIKEL